MAFLEHLDCQKSAAWIKTKGLLTESSYANGTYSIEILVREIIPMITEIYDFDYRDKSLK